MAGLKNSDLVIYGEIVEIKGESFAKIKIIEGFSGEDKNKTLFNVLFNTVGQWG